MNSGTESLGWLRGQRMWMNKDYLVGTLGRIRILDPVIQSTLILRYVDIASLAHLYSISYLGLECTIQ